MCELEMTSFNLCGEQNAHQGRRDTVKLLSFCPTHCATLVVVAFLF